MKSKIFLMRLGVLDVGSNSVHLEVIDAHHSAPPLAHNSFKHEIKLTEYLNEQNEISREGIEALVNSISESCRDASVLNLDETLAFATSAIREAENCNQVLFEVRERTGVDLQVLTGEEEAQFTFLAVRRWFGWSAGDLAIFDIGGGSLEIARGSEEVASIAMSVMLGAGRLTRSFLSGDPFTEKSLRKLDEHIKSVLLPLRASMPDNQSTKSVGTSKTFRTLEKLCKEYLPKKNGVLNLDNLSDLCDGLATMTFKERKNLPGISQTRAHQIVAGAYVARGILEAFQIQQIQICPWALREGIVLRRLDWLS